ncbi:MAG: sulfotransferase [Cyanobacteria bacterium P01_G01_bin.54]
MNSNKIFVVGLNKSGTTSFHKLFLANGLKSYHKTDWVRRFNDKQDHKIRDYQCFSDGTASNLKEIAKDYPEAIFILNTRSLKTWLISRFKHGYVTLNSSLRSVEKRGKPSWAYPPTKEKMILWIAQRNNHYSDVLTYFMNEPTRLYLINIEEPDWENLIGDQLGFEVTDIEPANVRRNETIPIISQIKKLVDNTFLELGYNCNQID